MTLTLRMRCGKRDEPSPRPSSRWGREIETHLLIFRGFCEFLWLFLRVLAVPCGKCQIAPQQHTYRCTNGT